MSDWVCEKLCKRKLWVQAQGVFRSVCLAIWCSAWVKVWVTECADGGCGHSQGSVVVCLSHHLVLCGVRGIHLNHLNKRSDAEVLQVVVLPLQEPAYESEFKDERESEITTTFTPKHSRTVARQCLPNAGQMVKGGLMLGGIKDTCRERPLVTCRCSTRQEPRVPATGRCV